MTIKQTSNIFPFMTWHAACTACNLVRLHDGDMVAGQAHTAAYKLINQTMRLRGGHGATGLCRPWLTPVIKYASEGYPTPGRHEGIYELQSIGISIHLIVGKGQEQWWALLILWCLALLPMWEKHTSLPAISTNLLLTTTLTTGGTGVFAACRHFTSTHGGLFLKPLSLAISDPHHHHPPTP